MVASALRYAESLFGQPCRRCGERPIERRNWYCLRCYARSKARCGRVRKQMERIS
jgi:hypothetical protein